MGTGSQPAATTNNNVVAVGFVLGATVRGARLGNLLSFSPEPRGERSTRAARTETVVSVATGSGAVTEGVGW